MKNNWLSKLWGCGCLLLSGCVGPLASQGAATPSPTLTQTSTPTLTATPLPPTATATPIPTISILMLTPTITPTLADVKVELAAMPEQPFDVWDLPESVIPQTMGIEIHFTQATALELNALQAAGVGVVRKDLFWSEVEREAGQYDFSGYDVLVNAMENRGIRVVFILDYGNALYDDGHSPHSDAGRAAFARFAATAARRYKGRGIIWEIWNEPNLAQFWYPEPHAYNYGRLVLTTSAAIRRVDPTAIIIGPALVSFPPDYWSTLGEMGVFASLDAASVHPYGVGAPEQILEYHLWLRRLLDYYSPSWKIPVISSESGYSTFDEGVTEGVQAQYVVRQWLFHMAHDMPLSVWYDWRNNGTDRADLQHHFGTVDYAFNPKPAYWSMQVLAETLSGYRFMRRIALGGENDYLLLFQKEQDLILAGWTFSETHSLDLPLPADSLEVVEMLGKEVLLERAGDSFALPLSPSPRYVQLGDQESILRMGSWRPYETINRLVPGEIESVRVVVANPFSNPRYVEVQVLVDGEVRGAVQASIPWGAEEHLRVPVDLEGLSGDVPAEVVFIPIDEALLPLQRAMIWLQIQP